MKRGHVYHVYSRRSGVYRFIGTNALKLLASLVIVGAAFYLFNEYVLEISVLTDYLTKNFSNPVILASFFASETTLGLLSPELFIAWANSQSMPWLWIMLLAVTSYGAGFVAYFIGTKLYHLPRIHKWVDEVFSEQFAQIKRFGGLLIVIASLTPLPYPAVCIVSGVVSYPFKRFALFALVRFARFALYAAVLFQVF